MGDLNKRALRRVAEAAADFVWSPGLGLAPAEAAFAEQASPRNLLALLDENEQLRAAAERQVELRRVEWSRAEAAALARWNTPETAPKDRQFLADMGWPWPVVARWNEYQGEWVTAQLEGNLCEGKDDPSYVTEYETKLKGWMELPEVKRAER